VAKLVTEVRKQGKVIEAWIGVTND